MDELKNFVKSNRVLVWCVIGALLFVLAAFCPVVSALGIKTANGFEVLFDGDGMGFSRFVILLMMLIPACMIVTTALNFAPIPELKGKLPLIHCAVSFVLGLLFIIAIPGLLSAAFGTFLYLLISAAGAVLAFVAEAK